MKKRDIKTGKLTTWCPGCFNYNILAGVIDVLEPMINKEELGLVTGIGCHAKIYDYLNIDGLNTLHGRTLPACLGLKIGNPNMKVIGFSGDGDSYSEGISHVIHAARYNADINLVVHDNQVFALTTGQPTSTTEPGFVDKTNPEGSKLTPTNPIKMMLGLNTSFVARAFAEREQVAYVLKEAMKHKGFSFVEIIQPCVIFHNDKGYLERVYKLEDKGHDRTNKRMAMKRAEEFDYSFNSKSKIPVGVFYQEERETFEDKYKILRDFKRKKISWKDIKR